MIFNEGFETHGILRRFLNPWYLTGVLKGFSRDLMDGLAGETTTLNK